MTVGAIYEWLDHLAPFQTQADFDNSGLLAGDPAEKVNRVLFALDATLPVVLEAAKAKAELIVTHHPLLFHSVNRIRYDQPEGAVLQALLESRIHLISAHTNLDQAKDGTGDTLAVLLGLTNVIPAPSNPYIRLGTHAEPRTAAAFLTEINRALGTQARLYGDPEAQVGLTAVGPGACGDACVNAAQEGAKTFVVGEIKHHELIEARALGLTVFEAGHFATEQPGLIALYRRFARDAEAGNWPVEARLSALTPYDGVAASQGADPNR